MLVSVVETVTQSLQASRHFDALYQIFIVAYANQCVAMLLRWFTVLLVLSVVVLWTPLIGGEAVSTMTKWQTITTQMTSTRPGVSTVAVRYVTSTLTGTLTIFPKRDFSLLFALGTLTYMDTFPHGWCVYYDLGPFSAKRSDRVTGTITTNGPLDFYAMSDKRHDGWASFAFRSCEPTNYNFRHEVTGTYRFDWSPSYEDGKFWFVFISYNPVDVTFDAELTPHIVTTTLAWPEVATVPQTLSFVVTLYTPTRTETFGSTFPTTEQSGAQAWDPYLIGGFVVVVVLMSISLLLRTKRRKQADIRSFIKLS